MAGNENQGMVSFVMPAGKVAIGIAALSYNEHIRLSITADESVISNRGTHEILTLIEQAIHTYIQMSVKDDY